MGFFDVFKKKEKPAQPETQARPEPILPYDTAVSITELDGQVIGDAVVHDSNNLEHTMHLIRKAGDLKLPDLPKDAVIRVCGCIHNKPFAVSGKVEASSRTELVLKDTEAQEALNKRSNFRVYVDEKATVTITEPELVNFEAVIKNISTTGAFIVCQRELAIETVIRIEALLSNKERKWKINTDAEVVRAGSPITKYGKTYYGYGILFPQFQDKELHKFTQWLNMMQTATRRI